jgi:hypothetical protein
VAARGKKVIKGKGWQIPIEEVYSYPDAISHDLCWHPRLAEGEIAHLILNILMPVGKNARLGYIFPTAFRHHEMVFLEVEIKGKTAPDCQSAKLVKFPMSRVAVAPGQMPPLPFTVERQESLECVSRKWEKESIASNDWKNNW